MKVALNMNPSNDDLVCRTAAMIGGMFTFMRLYFMSSFAITLLSAGTVALFSAFMAMAGKQLFLYVKKKYFTKK